MKHANNFSLLNPEDLVNFGIWLRIHGAIICCRMTNEILDDGISAVLEALTERGIGIYVHMSL